MQAFNTYLKKKIVHIPLGVVVLIIATIFIHSVTHKPVYETAKVEKSSFTREMPMTGRVVAVQAVLDKVLRGTRLTELANISVAGKPRVLVIKENGKTESRDVKTGSIDNSGNIEFTEGVIEGEVVVTNPPKS